MSAIKNENKLFTRQIIAVMVGAMLVSGVITFVVLQNIFDQNETIIPDTSHFIEQGLTNGVRLVNQPFAVQDFTLPSHTGDALSLSDLRGRYVMVFFGYTQCPDVCPLTANELIKAHEQLGDAAQQVQTLFVSVDGERDTPERLNNFLSARDAQGFMMGMQGDAATLERIGSDYNLFYELHLDEGEYYSVDHTSNVYLIDPQGELVTIFAYGTEPETISEHLLGRLEA